MSEFNIEGLDPSTLFFILITYHYDVLKSTKGNNMKLKTVNVSPEQIIDVDPKFDFEIPEDIKLRVDGGYDLVHKDPIYLFRYKGKWSRFDGEVTEEGVVFDGTNSHGETKESSNPIEIIDFMKNSVTTSKVPSMSLTLFKPDKFKITTFKPNQCIGDLMSKWDFVLGVDRTKLSEGVIEVDKSTFRRAMYIENVDKLSNASLLGKDRHIVKYLSFLKDYKDRLDSYHITVATDNDPFVDYSQHRTIKDFTEINDPLELLFIIVGIAYKLAFFSTGNYKLFIEVRKDGELILTDVSYLSTYISLLTELVAIHTKGNEPASVLYSSLLDIVLKEILLEDK